MTEASAQPNNASQATSSDQLAEEKTEDDSPWSIYDVLPSDWSQHQALLAQWKQGDLVRDVPLTWLTAPAKDPVTGVVNDREGIRPVFDPSLQVTAIICTQTCDLGATPPGNLHPFVLLAPLVHESSIPTNADTKLARSGKIGYLVRTLPPPASETQMDKPEADGMAKDTGQLPSPRSARQEVWFADLRLIFPVSKALLLSREPVHGFADEAASLAFAETLALKFRRAALNEVLSEALPQALRKFVQDNGHRNQAFAKVEQVRLLVLDGHRLSPARATLYVLTDGVTLVDEEREIWTRFQQSTETLFSRQGITLGPMVHADVSRLTAARYRETVPVRCDLLGTVHWP